MSGPFISKFGDVISSALHMGALPDASRELYNKFALAIGQISAIYTVDAEDNQIHGMTATNTVYDVIVMGVGGVMETIPRCRMVQPTFGGGINNFFEVMPSDPGFKGQDPKEDWALKRGHHVLIGFIDGQKDTAVIIGAMPHPNPVAKKRRPKKDKGTYMEGEIQGLNFSVDNDGALTVIFNGPRKDDGELVTKNGPTTINIDKSGNIKVSTNNKQTISINRETKKIRVDNGPTYIDMDQDADKIQIVAKTVEVGTGGLQPAVVGDDWKKIMEELIDAILAQTHPTGVGPSGTPINAAAFNAVKSKLKEALSKNHKVEK
jgi:hypothetical protein